MSITDKTCYENGIQEALAFENTTSIISKLLEFHRTSGENYKKRDYILFNVQRANTVPNGLVPAMDYLRRGERLVRRT